MEEACPCHAASPGGHKIGGAEQALLLILDSLGKVYKMEINQTLLFCLVDYQNGTQKKLLEQSSELTLFGCPPLAVR